ncbi:MAG TPA: hypothetical protein VH309_13930 [Elusimicrobiota bacterium]|nr:hypothetical protein [Elusimicrobiota bacterium]
MRRAPLAAALLLAASAAAFGDPDPKAPEPKTMKANFIGEGGGYKAPDQATDDYLVGNQAPPADASTPAAAAPGPGIPAEGVASLPGVAPAAAAAPSRGPVPTRTAAPGRSIAARPAASARSAPVPAAAKPAGRQSLWNGLVQPLAMSGAAAAEASDPDAARAGADRDYETHILGMKGAPERPSLASPSAAAAAAPASVPAAAAPSEGGKVFVSLALDPREAGSLRDAVAGLGAAAGFSADSRFEARPGPNGTVLYSGWIPAGRLGDAMSRPGVKSLRIETRAEPSTPLETSAEFLVGLRLQDPARAREEVDAGVSALKSASGFRLTRVIGLETAPDGRSVAVVSGFVPLSRLSQAMGLSEVAKIVPVGGDVPAPAAPAAAPGAGGVAGFAGFAVRHAPWLIILTLLLLLPSLRAPARRAAAIFSPYR